MGTRSLHVLERKSGQSQPVALELDDGTGANNADVSPDGKQSVFQRLQPGNYDLDVVRLTGGKPTTFVEHPAYEVSPIWSPDGKQIAFMSTRGFELGSIGPSFQDMSIFRTWMTAN
jgi:Tol biopolymer transport system component